MFLGGISQWCPRDWSRTVGGLVLSEALINDLTQQPILRPGQKLDPRQQVRVGPNEHARGRAASRTGSAVSAPVAIRLLSVEM
jgi:hypothetical protein